jgi:hypothetical protein
MSLKAGRAGGNNAQKAQEFQPQTKEREQPAALAEELPARKSLRKVLTWQGSGSSLFSWQRSVRFKRIFKRRCAKRCAFKIVL